MGGGGGAAREKGVGIQDFNVKRDRQTERQTDKESGRHRERVSEREERETD